MSTNLQRSSTLRSYYWLAKPGIVYGNAVTAIGGFLLASQGKFDFKLFVAMLLGISLVMASACVFNNYLDRDIDKKMKRTKTRALASGDIVVLPAMIYGATLGLVGFGLLIFGTNILTFWVAVIGFVTYVLIYSPLKPRSVQATLVGSIAGAVPPVVGYCAVSNDFDLGALLVFIILVTWQMPHFYSIAIYRLKDYKAAGIPVLPAVKGIVAAQKQITGYIVVFIVASLSLSVYGYTGYVYAVVMTVLGIAWLQKAMQGYQAENKTDWAHGLFRFSLIVLMSFSFLISVDAWLP